MLQVLAPLVGCGLMMAVCMGAMAFMGRGRRNASPADASTEIVARRGELERLRARDAATRREAEGETTP